MNATQIETETHQNPNMKTFNSRLRLPMGKVEVTGMGYHEQLNKSQLTFLSSMLAISGVEGVFSHGYAITITKGAVFAWSELDGPVTNMIRAHILKVEAAR